jgi:hypothetical protein
MSHSEFLPTSEIVKEFVYLFQAAIQLNHASGWNVKRFDIKSQTAFDSLKERFPWFDLNKIFRLYHFSECDCMCSKSPCVCFHYMYSLPDNWNVQVEDERE